MPENDAPTKPFWASKTIIANVVSALVAVGASMGIPALEGLQGEFTVLVMALVNIVLRVMTSKGVAVS